MKESTKEWWRANYSPKGNPGLWIGWGLIILLVSGVGLFATSPRPRIADYIIAVIAALYDSWDQWAAVPMARWDFYHVITVLALLALIRWWWHGGLARAVMNLRKK